MLQPRPISLATLSIKTDIFENIDLEKCIDLFAAFKIKIIIVDTGAIIRRQNDKNLRLGTK